MKLLKWDNFLKNRLYENNGGNHPLVDLLIDLTEFTIPHGEESIIYEKVEKLSGKSLNKDGFGNLFIKIGESKILFTAHLDTFSKKVEKVNHVIEGKFLKTDGTTILGGDNKVGCAILINMIRANIPGNYYFYCGEEVGRLGSEYHNSKINNEDYLLAVAFDRKDIGSICNYQRGIKLANDELVDFLITELNKTGYTFFKDHFGLSCDTFSFNEKVNNCINISTGVYGEHTTGEKIDLDYYKSLQNCVLGVDWRKVEELSKEKVRAKIDAKNLGISNTVIQDTLNYFIDNGYNPTRVPKMSEKFGIYTSNLYFKIKPKIFDYFYIAIKPNGMVKIDGKLMTKEGVMDYINAYKKNLVEFNVGESKCHITDINTESNPNVITVLVDDEYVDIETNPNLENLDSEVDPKLFEEVKKILEGSGILNFKGL
jgi:hypothetical protein